MGNQLVGVAPSQIFPVEHYLTGSYESDLQYESGMGSTRFLKVARAKSDEGLVVVKVFVKHDPSLPLEQHVDKIEYIKKNLANAVNCLPFQRVLTTERACLIIREYVKHSLYDRVSTRPFLTLIEKKWITFQILCAMHQCHKQKIYHGDIKLENIMITSWNWILLSDFASFKPTYLPEDNPADYSFFFDTSRRRTCYIAPERFVKSASGESKPDGPLVGDGPCYTGNLQPEMDIFSAGCALLELWTEGTAPFEFSQLLAYRRGEVEMVNKHLECIENDRLKSLLQSMLSPNPRDRKSAEIYLDQERGKLFPEYFYSFLQSYLQMFSTIPVVPADEKITRLHSDIEQIIKIVTGRDEHEGVDDVDSGKEDPDSAKTQSDNDGLILITAVVTSCIRGLKFCESKLSTLEILQKLAENTTSETILDRILPYILHLAQDTTPRVRVSSLDTLTVCLGLVKNLSRSDANVFPDYILPAIAPLATDGSTMVRVAYAKNIASLAETAVGFLEQSQYSCSSENHPAPHYETELSALHEMLHQSVLSLLTDPQPIVKQMLMESGITKLCVFFGRQKANDVILSHMITFLNDKEDKNLRGSFFDCIIGVAAFVGWHCSPMLIPLLQQGLTDPEEFVIAKAIRATTALVELGLIQKSGIIEFIAECACYLNHPNLWIRHEIVGLISTSAKVLNALDVQCKIMPSIANHLKCQLIQVEKPELLMDSLLSPIPRSIYDAVVKCHDINQLIEVLRERRVARGRCGDGFIPQYGEMTTQMKTLFRRLSTEGLTDLIESQLLSMSAHLIKLHRYKLADTRLPHNNGRISLDPKPNLVRDVPLCDLTKIDHTTKHKQRKSGDSDVTQEWQHMFTAIDSHSPSPTSPSNDSVASVLAVTNLAPPPQPTPTSSLVEYSMPERTAMQERSAECRLEFEGLINKLKTRYASYALNRELRDPTATAHPLPSGWKLNGTIAAHLHEHKAAVSRMTTLKPYGSLFATASIDSTVRLWDCNKLDGQQSINRSRQSYHANTPLHAIAACDAGQSLAIAGKDGALLLLKIDTNSSKMALQQARHLDSSTRVDRIGGEPQDDGPVVEMQPLDQGAQSVIVYATLYGALVGWDIRMPGYAWRLESDLRKGVITTFCVDPTSSWLTVGTSSGRHICWDLRFRLPIAEIKHPHDSRIRRVSHHPTEPSWLVSASQGNNEVYVWNIETGHRQQAFWASPSPPLSNTNVSSHSVCALLPGVVDGNGFLLTGGTDQRIRHWDPVNVDNCSLVVPAPRDYLSTSNISYESRLIDGTRVISEIHYNSGGGSGGPDRTSRAGSEDAPRSGPEMPASGHHDVISDMLMCRTSKQTFVVSSSRDGVVKLWK